MKNIITLFFIIIFPLIAHSNEENDCIEAMSGTNFTEITQNSRYTTSDKAGVKDYCHNKFPSWGERILLERKSTDPFNASYKVRRSYCWFRDCIFHSCGCLKWGDNYSADFDASDIKSPNDAAGAKILRSSLGLWGAHVCLKRFAPGQDYLQQGKNTSNKNSICGYVVLPLPLWGTSAAQACQSPLFNWNYALIGCVEEPLKPGPPTFNTVIPHSITPYVDPKIKLHDYTDDKGKIINGYISMGSKFDQPLIQISNGSTKGGTLLLRYKFPGDTYMYDQIPAKGFFESDPNKLVYESIVLKDSPDKVCICLGEDCREGITIGCVDRPTPKDSNLKIVADLASGHANNPAVYPRFAFTDDKNNIIYYDTSNRKVIFNSNGIPFVADSSGYATTTAATGKLNYRYLRELTDSSPISDFYALQADGKEVGYTKNSYVSYGLEFNAMVASINATTKQPNYIALNVPLPGSSGSFLRIAGDPLSVTDPQYYLPAGSRERLLCNCPKGTDPNRCPLPPETSYNYDPNMPIQYNEPDASRLYCPGRVIEPSQVENNNKICLQIASFWKDVVNDKSSNLCVTLPSNCQQQLEPHKSYGMSSWPTVAPGTVVQGNCSAEAGLEQSKFYQWQPPQALSAQDYGCSATDGKCSDYADNYLPQFAKATATLETLQNLANTLNRNLNDDEINVINNTLNSYSKYHILKFIQKPVERSCKIVFGQERGLVQNPCKFVNSCGDIASPTKSSGYAIWSKIGGLNQVQTKQVNELSQGKVVNFKLSATGKCAAGFKNANNLPPQRSCYIKYARNGVDNSTPKRVVEQWDEVENPCVKATN